MVKKQIGTSIECYALRGTLLSKIWTTSKAPRKDAGYLQISVNAKAKSNDRKQLQRWMEARGYYFYIGFVSTSCADN